MRAQHRGRPQHGQGGRPYPRHLRRFSGPVHRGSLGPDYHGSRPSVALWPQSTDYGRRRHAHDAGNCPPERKWQDRSVRRAEKRRHCAGVMRVGGPIRPHPGVLAHSSAAQGAKHLIRWQTQANLLPDRRPLGECRISRVETPEVRLALADVSLRIHWIIEQFEIVRVKARDDRHELGRVKTGPFGGRTCDLALLAAL